MFLKRKKKDTQQEDLGGFEELSLDVLEKISGGLGVGYGGFLHTRVRCPYPGCNFECNDFTQMNSHINSEHNQ